MARAGKLLLVAACLYCLLFQGIGSVGFLSADEPRYAAIGQEMARSGDWITPRLWGSVWLEKPPLLFWMTATAWKLGLRDEWAARSPLALMSLGFLIFFQRWVARQFDSAAGWRAAMMLATSAGWIAYSTVAVFDVPLAALFTITVCLAAPWRERISPWAGVSLGLATLTKSLVPIILILPVLWFWRTRWRALIQPALIALAVALPWYLACYAANGWPMIEELFLRQQFGRFFTNERQHVQPLWFYIPVLLGLLVPWTPALASLRLSERTKYFLTIAAFGFAFFSLSTNKLPGYLLPLLPLLAAAMAIVPMPVWAVAVSGGLAAALPLAASILPTALESGLGRTQITGQVVWIPLVIGCAAVAGLAEVRWRQGLAVLALIVAISISWAKWDVYPELDRSVSARGRWETIRAQAKDVCLDNAPRDLAYGLAYYNGALLPDCAVSPKPIRISK
jgi:4-amino-4-deoxy-L-arabinose transferase-like glycosyltransferase